MFSFVVNLEKREEFVQKPEKRTMLVPSLLYIVGMDLLANCEAFIIYSVVIEFANKKSCIQLPNNEKMYVLQ